MQPTSHEITNHQNQSGLEHIRAYVRDHYTEEMRIAELAAMAGFSKFHFHRLFRATFGETPRDHIRRIRLEQSACMLIFGEYASITDVAYTCGFSSSQSFTRAFKTHFGLSPNRVGADLDTHFAFSKKMQNMEGNYGWRYLLPREVRADGVFIKIPAWKERKGRGDSFQELGVVDMPSLKVASVRAVAYPGSQPLFQAMSRLTLWAAPKGLFTGNSLLLGAVGIIPGPEGRIIYDASLSVPEGMEADEASGIRIQCLPAGEYGVYHGKFQTMDEIVEAWRMLTLGWWMSSYFPRTRRPLYEIYYNSPDRHPSGSWIIDICLPISTLHRG